MSGPAMWTVTGSACRKVLCFHFWSSHYASTLRHMYVHGHLTAFAQGCAGAQIATICNEISRQSPRWIKCYFEHRLSLAAMF